MNMGVAEKHHFLWFFDHLDWYWPNTKTLKVRCRYRFLMENWDGIKEAIKAIELGYVD